MTFFQAKMDLGEIYKGTGGAVPGGGGTAYKLKEDYHYNNNNCMTLSCAGLDAIGIDWLGRENRPNDGLNTMQKNYKVFLLTRTEYLKGGQTTVTFRPPPLGSIKIDPSKLPTTRILPDASRAAMPEIVPIKSDQKKT